MLGATLAWVAVRTTRALQGVLHFRSNPRGKQEEGPRLGGQAVESIRTSLRRTRKGSASCVLLLIGCPLRKPIDTVGLPSGIGKENSTNKNTTNENTPKRAP